MAAGCTERGQFNALAELGRLWDGPSNGPGRVGVEARMVVLAVVVTPVALLLAGGLRLPADRTGCARCAKN